MITRAYRRALFSAIGIVFIGIVVFLGVSSARAEGISWVNPSPILVSTSPEVNQPCSQPYEQRQLDIPVDGATDPISFGCVAQSDTIKFAIAGYPERTLVSFPGDAKMHVVHFPCATHPYCTYIPSEDTLVTLRRPGGMGYYGTEFTVFRNFTSRLHPGATYGSNGKAFTFDDSNPDYVLNASDYNMTGYTFHVSSSGKWIVLPIKQAGFFKFSLDTLTLTKFSNEHPDPYIGGTMSYSQSITNDGVHVAIGGIDGAPSLYDTSDCGKIVPNESAYTEFGRNIDNPCPLLSLTERLDLTGMSYMDRMYSPRFSGDGGELTFAATEQRGEWRRYDVTLRAANYTPAPKLDYLALGDSISSGEGDTELKTIIQPQPVSWNNPFGSSPIPLVTTEKYYRPYTNNEEKKSQGIPREKCHLSTRSYPYYLAHQMNLAQKDWNSVACSGAKSSDVSTSSYDFLYLGQPKGGSPVALDKGNQRLEGYSSAGQLQATALNEFIPGRVQQIEFAKKYKPKIITLTMGANNIDFGAKMQECILPNTIGLPYTCSWADSKKATLASMIQGQYDKLTSLYRDLYNASGKQAKIFVAGYPKLVSDSEPAQCGGNIGLLNYTERQMIMQATNYLNEVIKRAAMTAGVKYVDISDALQGGRLCDDGQEYVNGVSHGGKNELQESFHPNDYGHIKIAQKIRTELGNKTLQQADVCADGSTYCPDTSANAAKPAIPSEFGTSTNQAEGKQVTNGVMKKGQSADIKAGKYNFEPNSPFTVTLHSDPVDLGTFTASSDGSFDNSVTIPSNVPAGYHTIIVSGKTYSGELVEFVQSVIVTGNDPNDLDENGTPDSQQTCGLFMTASGQDTDMDGIDDACDPEISSTPQLYRARLGDSNRTYAGQAEKEHYIYIERNARASSLTGISGDSDPDGDGWAIVGVSQGKQYTASSVPDTGPIANFTVTGDGSQQHPYQPIVSIRAGGWGCAQYKPTSLSKVTASQSRTLTRTATNTDTCRQEAPGDDVDNNGQPDNTQPLYLARQGDTVKGEDPARIYLYRNFYAAESQLGMSDYTPTGTAANTIAALPLIPTIGDSPNHPIFGRAFELIQQWSLLSVSRSNEYIPAFNKLLTIEDGGGKPQPIILTKKQNGQCIAYEPNNTGVIKFNQQNSLVKLTSVPEGVSCE